MPQWILVLGNESSYVAPLRALGALTVQVGVKLPESHIAEIAGYAPSLKFSHVDAQRFPCM